MPDGERRGERRTPAGLWVGARADLNAQLRRPAGSERQQATPDL